MSDRASGQVFSWRKTADDRVFIDWHGRTVTVLAGLDAGRFLSRIAGADEATAQGLMARATGNFRRGNEGGR